MGTPDFCIPLSHFMLKWKSYAGPLPDGDIPSAAGGSAARHCRHEARAGKSASGLPLRNHPHPQRKGKDYVFTQISEEGITLEQARNIKKLYAGATWALDQIVAYPFKPKIRG